MKTRLKSVPAALDRARRRAGLDRNPMRRREDHIQTAVGVLLVIVFLAFTPWAVAIMSGSIYSAGLRSEHAEAAARHQVTAKIFDPGPAVKGLRVSWRDARGAQHTGDFSGPGLAGATTTVWVDRSEHVVSPPHRHSQTIADAALTGVYVVLAILSVLGIAFAMLRRRLNRSRDRLWDAGWAWADIRWGQQGRRPEQP